MKFGGILFLVYSRLYARILHETHKPLFRPFAKDKNIFWTKHWKYIISIYKYCHMLPLSETVECLSFQLRVEAGNDMRVEVTGKGTGNIRVDLRYNVDKSELETCPFDIDVTSTPIDLDETAINIGKEK